MKSLTLLVLHSLSAIAAIASQIYGHPHPLCLVPLVGLLMQPP